MIYILIVFYAITAGHSTEYRHPAVVRSHAVVMQEFNNEQACRKAADSIMQAGASADCLPKGIK